MKTTTLILILLLTGCAATQKPQTNLAQVENGCRLDASIVHQSTPQISEAQQYGVCLQQAGVKQ